MHPAVRECDVFPNNRYVEPILIIRDQLINFISIWQQNLLSQTVFPFTQCIRNVFKKKGR